jgi:hypothetical protein
VSGLMNNLVQPSLLMDSLMNTVKTEYNMYHHAETGTAHLSSGMAYSLPEHISENVDIVMPTMHFDIKLKPTKYEYDEEAGHLVQGGSINGIGGKGAARPRSTISSIPAHRLASVQRSVANHLNP